MISGFVIPFFTHTHISLYRFCVSMSVYPLYITPHVALYLNIHNRLIVYLYFYLEQNTHKQNKFHDAYHCRIWISIEKLSNTHK